MDENLKTHIKMGPPPTMPPSMREKKCNVHPVINCKIHRRMTGEMNQLPFAANYIVLQAPSCVTHWVNIKRIIQLREKMIGVDKQEKPRVVILFSADGFNYEVTNVDITQFLAELHLARSAIE